MTVVDDVDSESSPTGDTEDSTVDGVGYEFDLTA
jgi:hypothetical protein